jgi:ubiquinone/menaquinone biosynthesis C-methylase UbiE
MALIDKTNIIQRLRSIPYIELELGCGNRKINRQAIGVDILDYPDVDIVGDVYEALALFPNQSVDAVYSYHFVEHVPDVARLISELSRIVKVNGHVEFVAPHFSNPYFYSDPTHRSFYGLYTFCYFTNKSPFARQVPTYGYKSGFDIFKVDLIFKSTRPFIVRYGLKKIIGSFFNSCNYLKEFYEENFCYLFPCYEVRYILRRQGEKD